MVADDRRAISPPDAAPTATMTRGSPEPREPPTVPAPHKQLTTSQSGRWVTKIALPGSPGASCTSTGPKPALASSRRATCSPQPVPSPAPPSARDTVLQCSRLMAYVIGATGLPMLSSRSLEMRARPALLGARHRPTAAHSAALPGRRHQSQGRAADFLASDRSVLTRVAGVYC
jgi:hypothetical protein